MSAQVSLGRLFIRFGIDNADLERGKAKATKELRDMERRAQQTQRRITSTLGRIAPWLTLSSAILGVGRALVSMGQDARALEDLHIQSGLSVQALYDLRQMVNQTGGSMSDLTTAVTSFNAAILTASRDSRSEAAQAFRQLGVSIRDANGNLTTLDQATEQMAGKFESWRDGAAKAALANTVFGGAATAMTRALNEGEKGVTRAKQEVDKYGRSIEDVHRQQLEWVRKTDDLSAALTHFRDQVITPLLPGLIKVTEWFAKLGDKIRLMRLDYLDDQVKRTAAEMNRLEEKTAALEKEFEELAARAPEAKARLELIRSEFYKNNAELRKAIDLYKQAREERDAFESRITPGREATLEQTTPKKGEPGRIQTGLSADQQRAMKALLDDVSLLQQRLDGLPTSLTKFAEVNKLTYDEVQARVSSAIDEINKKYKDQEDTVRNLHNLKMQLARQEQDTAMQTANIVGSAISSMFSKSKAAAMAETIIHTATAVMKTLRDVPWPYNLVQAAAIAAQGAASLAKIRSTTEKGGGSVGGGATPAAEPAAPSRALHVQGVDPGAFYSGPVVEGLIRNINDAVQNGATLIATKNVSI